MKKTLAAILAAAMALSTASVAFAKDTLEGTPIVTGDGIIPIDSYTVPFGAGKTYIIGADVADLAAGSMDPFELGQVVKDSKAAVTVTVTDGINKLDGKPSASVGTVHVKDTYGDKYVWNTNAHPGTAGAGFTVGKEKDIAKHGTEIKAIPLDENNVFTLTVDDVRKVVHPGEPGWKDALDAVNAAGHATIEIGTKIQNTNAPVVKVSFKIKHTYSTGTEDVSMKFRITFKQNYTTDAGYSYSKGDTIMLDAVTFTGTYYNMNDKGTEMELTQPEVGNNEVLMNSGDELYDKIGTDEFTVYFENTASFTGKMAPNQRALNLYYSINTISDIADQYPNIDFEFIDFKGQQAGKTTFVNTGSMAFDAIGGENTKVYEWDGEELEEIPTKYDKNSNTVYTGKVIKKLTTYVIASEEIVDEEPEEPASSAPSVEPDDNINPKTGAC